MLNSKCLRKSNIRRLTSKMTWMQPQWLCHTTFIGVLVLSQLVLCIFVLTEHMGTKKSNTEYTTVENNVKNSHLYPSDNRSLNGTHLNDGQKMEQLQPQYRTKDDNLLRRVHTLEVNIKSLTKAVSIQGEDIKALIAHQKTDGIKYEKALERQFNNMTTALNSLQNRLEEGLELSFSHISQLRDDVYFIENSLNRTKQERLGENETAMRSNKMRSTVQTVTEPQTHAPPATLVSNAEVPDSPLTENIQIIPSTAPAVSQENKEPREQHRVPTSFLKTRADFQVFFYGADKDADGYLTYEEIKNVLGDESPSEELLLHFDTDQDTLYSYTELKRTFLLKD
ncbi:EF-hand calcium-binding domain-containing protein 14-like isoform X2 [Hyla sarda]|uniref:EF-hand calcium-binding domain-containing protein 14-like isoform X2 n=1 Tax=Hyla sarda TaxID=327740 RepID=UPI0024C3B155|nr:EF-hand calcium-binding domain-containing protein 14-like isoform X2 [Hyla sarda]